MLRICQRRWYCSNEQKLITTYELLKQAWLQHRIGWESSTFDSNLVFYGCTQYWTSPGGNTQQSSSYTATYFPSRKLSNLDEPDMQDTAGEVGTSS